jgi:N-acetylglucosaminyldiphosphoundecaprenol N-acetyl-beta-D-mannosaminyltransferase
MSTKRSLLGVTVDAVTPGEATDRVILAAMACEPLAVSALAVHGVMTGALDPEHRGRLNALDLVVPDGQPVRWALNWLHGTHLAERVYGPQLMLDTCAGAAARGLPVFLYGSTTAVLERLQPALEARFPGLCVAGVRSSAFELLDVDAQAEVAAAIKASGARIVYVGLGCPRQETFCWAMRDQIGMPLLAVGAAFDFHAGLAEEAPEWMQRRGLQWLHRLARDPQRLWRRYLLLNPLYVVMVLAQRMRARAPATLAGSTPLGASIPG